jgi:hypothetical protein
MPYNFIVFLGILSSSCGQKTALAERLWTYQLAGEPETGC